MGKEIERKHLVVDGSFVDMAVASRHIVQGYLSTQADATVRVRIADDTAYITVKTRNHGAVRNEWEYQIPAADAKDILTTAHAPTIEKTRYIVPYEGFTWEVDVFHGRLSGLIIAEIELPAEDTPYSVPPFAGRDVTGDPHYYNSVLARACVR